MATTGAGTVAAAAAGRLLKTFRTGTKQVFLPSHMVTFLAPKPNQPPTFATFKVPLTFNKFDIRDYLLHAYRTPVVGVRAQLRQQRIRKSKTHGRIYRPPPIKTMTVQLTQPFVWPRAPTDVTPWRKKAMERAFAKRQKDHVTQANMRKKGVMPLRDEEKDSLARRNMRAEAKRILKEGVWSNKRDLDPRFTQNGGGKKR
ncbi:hypothetical protein F4678DRAFT_444959 [Xylaria arbuscula]|nr:hypothetical protein F4678DRAFT_444959 [Xylaria arbuscula]